uniref:dynein axonemal heavy chain 2-like n=1 Tax=Panthera onca TaxID=9690 RepID=UPI002955365F|nr:dynein axonemal heavy chain 2-like [Panthera onca]
MSSKEEKQRLSGQGSASRGARERASEATLASKPGDTALPPQPESDSFKEELEPTSEEPEAQKELSEPEADVKPLFLSRAVLTGLAGAEWTAEHDAVLEHFARDPSEPIVTIFIDPCVGLTLERGMPVQVGARLSRTPRGSARELRACGPPSPESYLLCPRCVGPRGGSA